MNIEDLDKILDDYDGASRCRNIKRKRGVLPDENPRRTGPCRIACHCRDMVLDKIVSQLVGDRVAGSIAGEPVFNAAALDFIGTAPRPGKGSALS